jgi:uncharacterized SAM-binding protein YcdF (DUF218 family)
VRALADLILPSNAAGALFALGILAYLFASTRRASWWLLATSGVVTLVFSSGMTAAALMSPLEYQYDSVHQPTAYPQAKHIVVLTGWAADDPAMPLTGRLSASSAYRVLMALELHRDRPDCDVIVSGDETTARIMGAALVKIGVPVERLRLEDRSPTTAASAAHLKPLVGGDQFFLVTSAGHLPRSIAAMEKAGLAAIAVPTDHQLPRDWRRAALPPSPSSLTVSDLAVHEYLGRLWYQLRSAA